jgi:isopenicillin-N epimerase
MSMRGHWTLDPALTFLNHGSFGACPRRVLEHQSMWRERLEASPVQFMTRELAPGLAASRAAVATFVGARPDDLAFMRNATEGVNVVLRSLCFEAGDELLTSSHVYPGCHQALRYVAERSGAVLRVVDVPFPIGSSAQVTEAFLSGVTPRTRLALVDHVTSVTGLVFPVGDIARGLRARGVPILVDGAHAPGMVDIDLRALGVDYYAANFHKWLCAPKGAGMLWVRPELQAAMLPSVISHGYAAAPEARFRELFDWGGTSDPTAWLSLPFVLELMQGLLPGGWQAIRARNHALALAARDVLCATLEVTPPAPDGMLGSLVSVPLPGLGSGARGRPDPLYLALLERGFETVVQIWPTPGRRVLRVSAQLYNELDEYRRLAQLLPTLL